MSRTPLLFWTLLLAAAALAPADVIASDADVEAATTGFERQAGLFEIFASPADDRVLGLLPAPADQGRIGQYIYASRLASGLGSNPVGLDRGAGDFGRLISLYRRGSSVIVVADNAEYRANSENPAEQRAVRDSFAVSVLWRTPVLAEASDGRILIDLSGFLIRDQLGLAQQLEATGQGSFSLDRDRSFVAPTQFAFPDNVELEAILTFSSSGDGDEVQATAPDARAVTFALHHSIVRLPPAGYEVRESDLRTATIDVRHYDFAQPIDRPLVRRYARRFRLEKTDPTLAVSPVRKPIVFYIDPGAPEPIRTALLEGGGWWAEAFAAAGFEDGYQVALLPEDAHPLDIRYNVVQWVHRQTRGWSYGGGVADPRTGEMLKGHVILGSQRVRQDRMIFEGLAGRDKTGTGLPDDPVQIALARIRQLSAHEIGHALGFHHNMAASTNDRASVMDYPAPLITATEVGLDFSDAYGVGVGAWDKFTVAWLYGEAAPESDQANVLDELVDEAYAGGLRFVADQHSRPVGGAHPYGSLWDNGSDPLASLDNVLAVRRAALADFGLRSLAPDQSVSDLQTVFAPIYLYHRYQVLAAAKLVGGYEFDYGRVSDPAAPVTPVPDQRQRQAVMSVLRTLAPDTLRIPVRIQRLMSPPIDRWEPVLGRERIGSRVDPIFDPQHAAGAAATLSLSALLHPQRLGRVALAHANDGQRLSVPELLRQTVAVAFDGNVRPGLDGETQLAVQQALIGQLIHLDGDTGAAMSVRAAARASLLDIAAQLRSRARAAQPATTRAWLADQVSQYLENGRLPDALGMSTADTPPGSPIGADSCWHCDSASLLR